MSAVFSNGLRSSFNRSRLETKRHPLNWIELKAPIAQPRAHVLDKSSSGRDGGVNDITGLGSTDSGGRGAGGGGVLSGRNSPFNGPEADAVPAGGGVAGGPGGAPGHFPKLNGTASGSGGSGDEGHGGAAGGASAALSSRVNAAASGVAVGNGPARSASPPGFPDVGSGGVGGGSDRGYDLHSSGGGGGRYGGGGDVGKQHLHSSQQQQQQQHHLTPQQQHSRHSADGFAGSRGVGGGGDFVSAMSSLSLGGGAGGAGGGGNKSLQYGGGGGGGGGSGNRMDPYNSHMMESSRFVYGYLWNEVVLG